MSLADWPLALIALALSQAVVIVIMWWRTRRIERQLRAMSQNRDERYSDVPTSMLVTSISRLEQRLTRLEASFRSTPSGTVPSAAASDRSYDLAQRLARQGASAEQITEACGIGLQEAELLLRLHAPR